MSCWCGVKNPKTQTRGMITRCLHTPKSDKLPAGANLYAPIKREVVR